MSQLLPADTALRRRILPAAGLFAVLASSAFLVWIESDVLRIIEDDVSLMAASQRIASGHWAEILRPHAIHLFPLFRILRLPFDLHFPEGQAAFHAAVAAAHLLSTAILFFLARHYLHSTWAATFTAVLFGWSRVGQEALTWKAASPFALTWTFVLLALWCLTRKGPGWNWAAAAALLLALGFYEQTLLAVPGVLAAAILLTPDSKRRAFVILAFAGAAGGLAWIIFSSPTAGLSHHWKAASPQGSALARLGEAAADVFRAWTYQLSSGGHLVPGKYAWLLLPALGLALVWLRRDLPWRWILSILLLTLPPLFVILLIRKQPGIHETGRYAYQSYTLWAVALGCVLDAVLARLKDRLTWRIAATTASAALAWFYFSGQVRDARHAVEAARAHQATQREFWLQWKEFFRLASAHRMEIGRPLRLPPIEAHPGMSLYLIYKLCHPRGLPGLVVEEAIPISESQEEENQYWQEVERGRARLPGFNPPRLASAPAVHAHPHEPHLR